MLINILLLIVGFVLLIKGADFFVDGSSSVARHIGIPAFVVGLTIAAMGTSAPEAAVSITAGIAGSNELAISNVIGSNMFNLLVVAGFCAVLGHIFPVVYGFKGGKGIATSIGVSTSKNPCPSK